MSKVAIYCRLSEEDKNKSSHFDDSESIKNQKSMLTQYATDHLWEIYDIYSDDDYTGSDRKRPEFNRLLRDAEAKKFDIVLCKTQSRFTREIEMVEKYIHYYFPIWGIRFISIVDNADTAVVGNKKSRQINGLINEWYLEDMSENIKAVLTNRRKNGFHIGAFAPYGYKKDPTKKGHLIIDENAADIVREIYSMYISGIGKKAIARTLNERGVLSPGRYKIANGEKYKNTSKVEDAKWHDWTVTAILSNEVYIGNLVQNKAHSVSYKTKLIKPTDKSEWIRAEGTHEPIVAKDVFEQAREISKSRINWTCTDGYRTPVNVLAGKIFCGKCKSSMRTCYAHNKRFLRCSGNVYDRNYCSGTYILYSRVINEVLAQIQNMAKTMLNADYIESNVSLGNDFDLIQKNLSEQIASFNQANETAEKSLKSLYLDKANGMITPEMFSALAKQFADDVVQNNKRIEELQKEQESVQNKIKNQEHKAQIVSKYLDCNELTYEMVQIFIDKVYVNKNTGVSRSFQLEIFWNF